MAGDLILTLILRNEAETTGLARRLAQIAEAGDVFLLSGPIGAGKTHFARAFIKARLAQRGEDEDVPSPTFTLVQTYWDGEMEIWHADLYRLADTGDIAELGLDAAFDEAICLVEWPDRLGDMAPPGALGLDFDPDHESGRRSLRIRSADPRWAGRLRGLGLEEASELAE